MNLSNTMKKIFAGFLEPKEDMTFPEVNASGEIVETIFPSVIAGKCPFGYTRCSGEDRDWCQHKSCES